ncbi:Unassigned protein [Escherichia coli NCCP15648]|nr:Unassigned protein [Escherichia coli NCCP15648]
MECQNRSDKYIWSPHDAYFYKGLSELIVDIGDAANLLI